MQTGRPTGTLLGMRYTLRNLMVVVTFVAVICGQAVMLVKVRAERDELGSQIQDHQLARAHAEAEVARERALVAALTEWNGKRARAQKQTIMQLLPLVTRP